MGEKDWERLTEIQRQRKVLEMKKKERRLRKEGRMDEINALLGEALKDKEVLDRLLGTNKEEQERKIKERLEKRQRRLAEGITDSVQGQNKARVCFNYITLHQLDFIRWAIGKNEHGQFIIYFLHRLAKSSVVSKSQIFSDL